jgi:hypothetical protein
MNIFREIASKR